MRMNFLERTQKLRKDFHQNNIKRDLTQPAIICSKLTKETLEQGVKYVQS